jgi:hypothetical protein
VSGDGPAADPASERREQIGWFRGIVTGLVITVVTLVVSVGSVNEILTQVTGVSRDTLTYLASAVFLFWVVVAAWVLRRLQSRGVI